MKKTLTRSGDDCPAVGQLRGAGEVRDEEVHESKVVRVDEVVGWGSVGAELHNVCETVESEENFGPSGCSDFGPEGLED